MCKLFEEAISSIPTSLEMWKLIIQYEPKLPAKIERCESALYIIGEKRTIDPKYKSRAISQILFIWLRLMCDAGMATTACEKLHQMIFSEVHKSSVK